MSRIHNVGDHLVSQMLEKLKVDDPFNISHGMRQRMFQELCWYPKVDSRAFAHVAKKYGICVFRIGPPPGTGKLDADGNALFESLAPLYSSALHTINLKASELEKTCIGRGIRERWAVCGVSNRAQLLSAFHFKQYDC